MQALSPAEVIEQNRIATEHLVLADGPVDKTIAGIVLHNIEAVAASLTRDQFAELGKPAVNALLDAAASVSRLAPLPKARLLKSPTESTERYELRANVQEPFSHLIELVDAGAFDHAEPQTTKDLKSAIWRSGVAFEAILTDPVPDERGNLGRTISYLGSNALAEARRAKYLESHTPAVAEADKKRPFVDPAVIAEAHQANRWERGYDGSSVQ